MEAAAFAGSFLPIVQCEKWEIHPVFRHFPHFRLKQNLSPKALAPLCGIALILSRRHRLTALSFGKGIVVHREQCSVSVKQNGCQFHFFTLPGAGHGLSYIVDTETYSEAVSRFVSQCLQNDRKVSS